MFFPLVISEKGALAPGARREQDAVPQLKEARVVDSGARGKTAGDAEETTKDAKVQSRGRTTRGAR